MKRIICAHHSTDGNKCLVCGFTIWKGDKTTKIILGFIEDDVESLGKVVDQFISEYPFIYEFAKDQPAVALVTGAELKAAHLPTVKARLIELLTKS